MTERNDDLGSAIAAVASDARASLTSHVTPEDLCAYHERLLAERENDRVQEHLSLCPTCTALLLDLAAFSEMEDQAGAGPSRDDDVERAWASFRLRLVPAANAATGLGRPRVRPWAYAAAAGWLLATGALGLWVVRLRERVEALSQPRVNLLLVQLSPRDDLRDASEPGSTVRLAEGQDDAVLVLDPGRDADPTPRRAELFRDDRGARTLVWARDDLHPDAGGLFSVQFPRRDLPPGRYLLCLSAARTRTLEYGFVVTQQ